MNVTIIGTGFVGIVSACVYAKLGNQVIGLDVDPTKIEQLRQNRVPFFEPDLEILLKTVQTSGLLRFTNDYHQAIHQAQVVIIAVGTPSAKNGNADLKFVFSATESLAPHLADRAIVAVKSTVPPGTLSQIKKILDKQTKVKYYLASLPEFLREGRAVHDTLHPDRVVIGAYDEYAFAKLSKLHQPLKSQIIKVSPESAQMGKYTANAYLATRITFINQVADLCEKNGADINQVIEVIGHDRRIGHHYWYPGLGYGGSCFPKDVNELAAYSRSIGQEDNLLITIHQLNQERIKKLMTRFGQQVGGWLGKKVAVLGLSFKPQTNDMRQAPSIEIITQLLKAKAQVRAYDPQALDVAKNFLPSHPALSYHQTIVSAGRGADVIMAVVEWPEIIKFDYSQLRITSRPQWIIDARNQLQPSQIIKLGFQYLGIGVPS